MKYIVIERNEGRTNYYGPFHTEMAARRFVAGTGEQEHVMYEISELYSSKELTRHINSDKLYTKEGTSPI